MNAIRIFVWSFVVAALAILGLAGMSSGALAQSLPKTGCVSNPGRACQVGNDLRAARLIQWSHQAAESVREALAQRYFSDTFPETSGMVQALGYSAETGDDNTGGAFDSFDAPQQPASPLWNVWVNPTGTYSNRQSSTDGFAGWMGQMTGGFDRQLGGGAVLGGFVTANSSSYDTTSIFGDGTSDASGAGIGAYAGLLIGDSLFASVTGQYGWTRNSFVVGPSSADYDSRSASITGNLTGYYYIDRVRFSPIASISWSREWQDGYTETSGAVSPSRTTDAGVASLGFEAGYTLPGGQINSIEPWVGGSLDWTYLNQTTPAPAATADPINDIDVKLSGGINAAISESVSLSLRTDFSGLTTPDYIVAGVGGQLSGRF